MPNLIYCDADDHVTTARELREALAGVSDDTPVHIRIQCPSTPDEMHEDYPGYDEECILFFKTAYWDSDL